MSAGTELFLICSIFIGAFLYFQAVLFIMGTFNLWSMGMAGILVATMVLFVVVYFISLIVRLWRGE